MTEEKRDVEKIKELLSDFSKAELVDLFPSLELKKSDSKTVLIDNIAAGEPTKEEQENFAHECAEKAESSEPTAATSVAIGEGLGYFTKAEMVSFFPSLQLNETSGRPVLVAKIVNGSPEGKEVDEFKKELAIRVEDGKLNSKDKYIVEHNIKENGKLLKKGDAYRGRKVDEFLEGGQIEKRV